MVENVKKKIGNFKTFLVLLIQLKLTQVADHFTQTFFGVYDDNYNDNDNSSNNKDVRHNNSCFDCHNRKCSQGPML